MKLICVAGHSGAGKTTLIKSLIRRLPEAKTITCDKFMFESVSHYRTQFEEMFNFSVDETDCANSFRRGTKNIAPVKLGAYFKLIVPYVERRIIDVIGEMKKQGTNYLFIDWLALPYFNLWASSDYRILVHSPEALRADNLKGRLLNEGYSLDDAMEQVKLRYPAVLDVIENANPRADFTVHNKYDKSLRGEAEQILKSIRKYMR